MNKHLKPIFEIVITKIQSANIDYWVYGGVGYAAIVGRFYRPNADVDLFVLENNFEEVKIILEDRCKENRWEIRQKSLPSGRPKIKLFIEKRETMSIIPVYKKEKTVEFKFPEGPKEYPHDRLAQIPRYLDDFVFITPPDILLKELLIDYFESKSKYPDKRKRLQDARHILSEEEFKKYFPNDSYT